MVQSMRLLVQEMEKEGMTFPLHLDVTEAGEGEDGRIKSAVGIGALLTEGIGDTIRVSLSEAPEKEIPVARQLVDMIPECTRLRQEAEESIQDDTVTLRLQASSLEELQLKASMAVGALFIDKKAHELNIEADGFNEDTLRDLADSILQAARIKFVMLTPGISTGYWNDRNSPSWLRSSGASSRRFLPLYIISPSVTVYAGCPTSTLLNVLFPEPLGPIMACTSPALTVRFIPFNISLPSIVA
jgi:4-hydroxy-3-methylbut-2-en-1-yl diphosphate synthase IspG/GcpE